MNKYTIHLLIENWTHPDWKDEATNSTLMILSFRTDGPGQTVQTQIRLLLEEQSNQGLHCLQLPLHHLDTLLYGKTTLFKY